MKITKTLVFIVLFFSLKSSAQKSDNTILKREFWFGFQTISPLGDFARKSEITLGVGIDLGFLNKAIHKETRKFLIEELLPCSF